MASQNSYTGLIAGAHREKERFNEWVYQLTESFAVARERLADMPTAYDIDFAEGAQLDAVGVRVGLARKLNLRISDVFFAFDDVDGIGFDLGIWKEPRDSTFGITELGDDIYRKLLKAKVALNQYGGKNEDVEAMLNLISDAFELNSTTFSYTDGQDMSISLGIKKDKVPPIVWKIFASGVFKLTHAGVGQSLSDRIEGVLATMDARMMASASGELYIMDVK